MSFEEYMYIIFEDYNKWHCTCTCSSYSIRIGYQRLCVMPHTFIRTYKSSWRFKMPKYCQAIFYLTIWILRFLSFGLILELQPPPVKLLLLLPNFWTLCSTRDIVYFALWRFWHNENEIKWFSKVGFRYFSFRAVSLWLLLFWTY